MGTRRAATQRASRGRRGASARRSTPGLREPPAGEAGRPLTPGAAAGLEQPGGHERARSVGPSVTWAEAVELVAEAGGRRGLVADGAVGAGGRRPGCRPRRPAGATTSAGWPGRSPSAAASGSSAGARHRANLLACASPRTKRGHDRVHGGVEHRLARPPQAVERGLVEHRPRRIGAASRGGQHRLREDEPDPPAVGPGQRRRPARGTRRRRRRRARRRAATGRRRLVAAASWFRYGGLPTTTSNRRAPRSTMPRASPTTTVASGPRRAAGDARPSAASSSMPTRHPAAVLRRDPEPPPMRSRGGGEEAAVAASRIEHAEPVERAAAGQHGFEDDVEDVVHQPGRGRPGAPAASRSARASPAAGSTSAAASRVDGTAPSSPVAPRQPEDHRPRAAAVYSRRSWPSTPYLTFTPAGVGGPARRHAADAARARPRAAPGHQRAGVARRGGRRLPPAHPPAEPLRGRRAEPAEGVGDVPRHAGARRCRT